ncbi:AAA family ATPase [Blastopirellula marina]|nr:AAA family ATPase [Blastopirellula marina]
MNAILLGPRSMAQSLEGILAQRGVRVAKTVSQQLSGAREELLLMQEKMDFLCIIAEQDPSVTRSTLQGLRLLTDKPIILFGAVTLPAEIMRFIRAGATDYINVAGDFTNELDEILFHMRDQSKRDVQSGEIVAFCGASGGVGVTTLAVNCGIHLAQEGASVVLVDLNLCGGDASLHLGLQPESNILECAVSADDIHAVTVSKLLARHESGLNLLAAPQFLDGQEIMQPESVHRTIGVLAAMHDYVIIDMEDVFHREQIAALTLVDHLYAVFRIEFPSLVRTRRLLDYLSANEMNNVHLCANRMAQGSGISKERAEPVLRRSIDYLIPEETRMATDAVNVGVPAVVEYPRSKLAKACVQISGDMKRNFELKSEINHVSEPIS